MTTTEQELAILKRDFSAVMVYKLDDGNWRGSAYNRDEGNSSAFFSYAKTRYHAVQRLTEEVYGTE